MNRKTTTNSRKAAIRNSPAWLDLPAEAPLARVYPAPRVRASRPLEVEIDVSDLVPPDGRNAAEIWGATLPTLAEMCITEERVRRERRSTTPLRAQRENYDEDGGVIACAAPPQRHRSAFADATRNAGLLCAVAALVIAIVHAL